MRVGKTHQHIRPAVLALPLAPLALDERTHEAVHVELIVAVALEQLFVLERVEENSLLRAGRASRGGSDGAARKGEVDQGCADA